MIFVNKIISLIIPVFVVGKYPSGPIAKQVNKYTDAGASISEIFTFQNSRLLTLFAKASN